MAGSTDSLEVTVSFALVSAGQSLLASRLNADRWGAVGDGAVLRSPGLPDVADTAGGGAVVPATFSVLFGTADSTVCAAVGKLAIVCAGSRPCAGGQPPSLFAVALPGPALTVTLGSTLVVSG